MSAIANLIPFLQLLMIAAGFGMMIVGIARQLWVQAVQGLILLVSAFLIPLFMRVIDDEPEPNPARPEQASPPHPTPSAETAESSPTPQVPAPSTAPDATDGADIVPLVGAIAGIVLGAAALAMVLYFVWVAVVRPKARAAARARAAAAAQAERDESRRAERRAAMGRAWRAAIALEERVTSRWLAYEKDLQLALQYPVMRDLRDPLVQKVVTAMTRARAARVDETPEIGDNQSPAEHPYVAAVHELDVAMRAAEQEARRVRQGRFTREERRALHRAEQLLQLAKNDGASPHERRLAYERLIATLEGILDVPEAARAQLEISAGARGQIGAPAPAL
ncbi:hypothetical protein [Cellulosimicrobium cellulans]|uniref:hypothetical protein n=1 Tax=Cellulosimicrobium cellulans TaxID=1710 RepID=UPI0014838B8D|nr:hypothetical protein [Cellulosimicrobium cellulans]